jgi:cyanophycinase
MPTDDYAQRPGFLMPIGGAEDKVSQRLILNRFVQLSGGSLARIVVIPTASVTPTELGIRYCEIFNQLGACATYCLDIKERREANDLTFVSALHSATGIFMTGGDQVKLLSLVGGTLAADLIHQRYKHGATIAGTSAGASAMSRVMIAFGRSGGTPSQRMVQLAPGLGLTEDVIIDQHFRQRDRLGRLTTAVTFNPAMLGIGIDEDTSLVISADHSAEVIGSGGLTIVDGSELEYSDIHTAKRHSPITVVGMKVHILTHGHRYNLVTRKAYHPEQPITA